jgi:hypothetical protein
MTLQGMKLHLLLLAMASSSGYVLFYLASGDERTAFSRNLAHWTRFAVETPVKYVTSVIERPAPTAGKTANAQNISNSSSILISGHANTALLMPESTNPTREHEQLHVSAESSLRDSEVRKDGVTWHQPDSDVPSPLPISGVEGISVAPDVEASGGSMLAFGNNNSSNANTAFMDTSLLVAKGQAADAVLNSGSDPSLLRSSDTDALQSSLRSETTAGLISPGESFVGEINLAARAYVSNTLEFKYQMNVGFVVETPNTELVIYALASNLESYGVTAPGLPPAFQVYDAAGQLIITSNSNQLNQTGDPAVVHVFEPGTYQVVVSAAKGSAGEVVVGIKDYYSVQVE